MSVEDREERRGTGAMFEGAALAAGSLAVRLWPGALWLAFAVVAAGVAFHDGFAALWRAWQQPEYSHGPLIPIISGYLFLRQLKHVEPGEVSARDRIPGLLVMGLALILGTLGELSSIHQVSAYAIIVWIAGVVLVSFGWTRGRQFWPPVLHLAFMLPLPGTLFWKTSLALQFISSEIGVGVIQLMNIPVYLDGNIIDLGAYKLHVAEACSGLRYLFPVMSFTYIFAVLYQGSLWHKGVLLLIAVPLTVLMNSFRIGVIGVMVDNFGIEYAEGFLHLFEGWVIFISVIGIMFALSWAMARASGDRRPLAEALDLDTQGLGAQAARIGDVRPSGALLGSSAALLAVGLFWILAPAVQPPSVDRDPFVAFPRTLGEWSEIDRRRLNERIENVLGADDYLAAKYATAGSEAPVELFIAWYLDQTDGGIHSPEICIPGSGWEMADIRQKTITVDTPNGPQSIPVNRAVIQKGMSRQLVYYWFDQRGRRLTSDYAAKAYLLLDSLGTGRTDGALLRLTTPIVDGEAQAEARLQAVLGEASHHLPRFIDTQ